MSGASHFMSTVRCKYYDENGDRIGRGCLKGPDCHFIHPTDPRWDNARIPNYYASDRPYESNYRPPRPYMSNPRGGFGRERSPSPTMTSRPHFRHGRNDSTSSSKAREHGDNRGVNYGDPGASSSGSKVKMMDSDASHTRGRASSGDYGRYESPRSPTSAMPWGHPTTPNRPEPPPTTAGTSMSGSPRAPPTAPRWGRASHPMSPQQAPPASAPVQPSRSTAPARPPPPATAPLPPPPPATAPAPPPPPPSEPAPLKPLPPIPDVPNILRINNKVVTPLTAENQKLREQLWEERIALLAESVLAHEEIQSLTEEVSAAKSIVNSPTYHSLDTATQVRLQRQYTKLKSRLQEAVTLFKRQDDKLCRETYWPTPPEHHVSKEEEEQYTEIKSFVNELNSNVIKMTKMLDDIADMKLQRIEIEKGNRKEFEDDNAMEVDVSNMSGLPQASGSGTHKRRRLSSGYAAAPARVTDPTSPDYIPTAEELESMRTLLMQCEHSIVEMRNEITRAQADYREETASMIETTVQEVREQQQAQVEAQEKVLAREREHVKAEVRANLRNVTQQAISIDTQLGEVTSTLASLVLQADRLEQEVEEERLHRNSGYEMLQQIEGKFNIFDEKHNKNSEAVAALRTALEVYLTRPPSPPNSPPSSAPLPPVAYILQSLEPTITDVARETIRPLLHDLRGEIEDVIRQSNAEMYQTFWERTTKARQVVQAISQQLPQIHMQQQHALASASTGSTQTGASASAVRKSGSAPGASHSGSPSSSSTRMV